MKTNAQRMTAIDTTSVLARRGSCGERRLAATLARTHRQNRVTAFTLLEVMIACGIFFIAVFAILALVSNTLRNAQRLRRVQVDAGIVCAQLFRTNRITEGIESGDLSDFGYPDYTWQTEAHEHEQF